MRVSFRVSMVTTIMVLIVGFSMSVLISLWIVSSNAAQENASQLFTNISSTVNDRVDNLIDRTVDAASIGSELSEDSSLTEFNQQNQKIPPLITILASQPELYSLYFGYQDGAFLQVIATRGNELIKDIHDAPEKTAWIIRRIYLGDDGIRIQKWEFWDEFKNVLGRKEDLNPAYDPRERPWYKGAIIGRGPYLSDVYIFNSSQKPGITAAHHLVRGGGVFGADLTLEVLNDFVNAQDISDNAVLSIFNNDNKVIAISNKVGDVTSLMHRDEIKSQLIQDVFKSPVFEDKTGFFEIKNPGQTIFANVIKNDFYGNIFEIVIFAPKNDFQTAFQKMQKQVVIYSLLVLAVFLPLAYVFSSRLTQRVMDLAEDARKIMNFEFSHGHKKPSKIKEFYELETSFFEMNDSLDEKTKALNISQAKLGRLVELGIALSAERDLDKLMDMVLSGAKDIANADGGTLYKIDGEFLEFKIFKNDKIDDGAKEQPVFNPIPLFNNDGTPNDTTFATSCVHLGAAVNIENVSNEDYADIQRTKAFDERYNFETQSILTVPLKPRGGEVVGVLQLVNARNSETGEIVAFNEEIKRFCEALSSQAATIMHNVDLFDGQELLMDAMIQIMAGAIDAKSPYTGGHCLRVPELAMMLAKEASDEQKGPLGQFEFENEEQWREFSIGAWLHDCGKVVTPEYVVDKATKLETIYNRIHEVRTRFEVLLRDVEIECLKKVQAEPDKAADFEEELQINRAQIIDDFIFVAKANVGGEFMAPQDIERIHQISKRTWVRNLDMKLGLSHQEELIYAAAEDAPCVEKVLDDKEYHVIPRERDVLEQYAALDFKVDIPKNQYNRGELYNLSVSRGTLSDEERFKINEHIMQTILMLETLPFPAHLKRVPEYAGTHHETMIGTGYPRKLSEDDLSIPARIMAIADIFEALTASDRPYKKAKTLSEAIQILYIFKKDNHIDPVLFDLFLTSGVYKDYAEKFLLPEQIDEVDIEQYLSKPDEIEPLTA